MDDTFDTTAEDETVVSLNDVLQQEDDLVQDAGAILGAANDKTCSYNDGYIKRQALYACLTCTPEARDDPQKGAGVCLACSYHCHDGHELVELYTKRNFRCDCGNSKFHGIKCNLCEDKDATNENNHYNQNFSGIYCVCHRPYPDAEDPLPDEMIQCIICEDWYHSRHLGVDVPETPFSEMICESCVTAHTFLLHYETLQVDVVSEEDKEKCTKPETKADKICAKFWHDINWRSQLCTCTECSAMYQAEHVAFLIEPEDPVHLYEEKSKAKAVEAVKDQETKFMNSMDRVQLVEVLAGYNDLKENLAGFLQEFSRNKRIIRVEDVKEFFDGMMARKKQKLEVSVPHHCR